jgi:hypothetical protein
MWATWTDEEQHEFLAWAVFEQVRDAWMSSMSRPIYIMPAPPNVSQTYWSYKMFIWALKALLSPLWLVFIVVRWAVKYLWDGLVHHMWHSNTYYARLDAAEERQS